MLLVLSKIKGRGFTGSVVVAAFSAKVEVKQRSVEKDGGSVDVTPTVRHMSEEVQDYEIKVHLSFIYKMS